MLGGPDGPTRPVFDVDPPDAFELLEVELVVVELGGTVLLGPRYCPP